ncbi:hypothetical protein [Corynebacterium lactis]|uniref:Uncharacterized protein n=1 Tax=Corynebacterium lactis RW2-5 TaxID=1408189 RepID=A0A0K2H3I3_9CORY|nr:hypothetical protein [Corynebacterium lactis]ALA68597.1 hypothetical protein CLAC_08580 [Corynebacterium lactis RW2-5]
MARAFDSVGQWLIQLPLLLQVSVLVAVLLIVGGLAAFALVGVIDIAHGRLWRAWGKIRASKTSETMVEESTKTGSRELR